MSTSHVGAAWWFGVCRTHGARDVRAGSPREGAACAPTSTHTRSSRTPTNPASTSRRAAETSHASERNPLRRSGSPRRRSGRAADASAARLAVGGGRAAVDGDDLAGDVLSVLGRQEQRDAGEVLGHTDAAEREAVDEGCRSSSLSAMSAVIGVLVKAGAMPLMRTPLAPQSRAALWMRPLSAYFVEL